MVNAFNSPRLRERRYGLDLLSEITKDKAKSLVIHYSCESFITNHGLTPRVTSICIKNINTGQTMSFSIHLQAQFNSLDINSLSISEYDKLELLMLNEFSEYDKAHTSFKWVHWNMRDSNYGFEAINNRIRILKGVSFDIDDDRKYDFPRILALIYTVKYENNKPSGRLLNLALRNNIGSENALTGGEEAKAFDDKQYLKLHMSTLKKVDIIEGIITRTNNDELIVVPGIVQVYGLTIPGIFKLIKDTPWLLLIATAFGYLLKLIVEPLLKSLIHLQ